MKNNGLWIGLIVIVAAGAGYWYFTRKKPGNKLIGKVTKADILALMPADERAQYEGADTPFDKMIQQELDDSYRLVKISETGTPQQQEDLKKDAAFIGRINAISEKYGIFT